MKRKTMKKKLYLFNSMLATALFAAALAVSSCADNDLDKLNSEGDKGAAVRFDVKDVQEAVLADANTGTTPTGSRAGAAASFNHQLCELGLTQADLEPQVLEAQTPAGMEACLVESTIPGINPVQPDPQTRATVTKTLTADFSTLGYRATSPTAVSSTPDWFYNARTKSNGELYDKLYWSWSGNRFGRFYAVFPEVKNTYSKIKLSPATHAGNPYVDFEVDPDVANQKDLMTACSGVVEYQTQGVAPNTSLAFRHALTAIHFTVGQNLWAGRIDKIEISGAISKGTYTLSSDPNQPGTWALGTTTGTFTLSGININTVTSPGSVITDDNGNYTFFMIPQQVTGKNIYVDIHFQDGKTIHVPLKGKWLPGTTKTYTLSNKDSNWEYKFEVNTNIPVLAYNETDAGKYYITSYRRYNYQDYPVAWKVISYQESTDNGATWSPESTTPPDWLDNISLSVGAGGYAAQQGTVKIKKGTVIDKLAAYNNVLKTTAAKGGSGNYYNLANQTDGGATIQNTANSYLISAPGYYRIPLVYGNAIAGGAPNTSSYVSSVSGYNRIVEGQYTNIILPNFKDHNRQDINSPYINVQNASNPATQASLVWADQSGLVENLSVTNSGQNSFVNFHVPADKIRNGNAVIAVKNASGTVMWSWHLWFDHSDALKPVQMATHKFPQRPLGAYYERLEETTYSKRRQIKIKVQQSLGNTAKKVGYITIYQDPGTFSEEYMTLYTYGRKDALPGVADDKIKEGSMTTTDFGLNYENSIQNPDKYYYYSNIDFQKFNLWSINNEASTVDNFDPFNPPYNPAPVVKTVYDPTPVGYRMPLFEELESNFHPTPHNTSYVFSCNYPTSDSDTPILRMPCPPVKWNRGISLGPAYDVYFYHGVRILFDFQNQGSGACYPCTFPDSRPGWGEAFAVFPIHN